MARISIQIQQSGSLAALIPRLRAGAAAVVDATARDLEAAIKQAMENSGHGATYGTHQASAPSEAPAIDSGAYYGAIETIVTGQLERAVVTDAPQAAALEYGDDEDGRSIEPRPAWTPAADAARPQFVAAMQRLEERLS